MRTPIFLKKFKKELEKCRKRGLNVQDLRVVLERLINDEPLEVRHRPHLLSGNYVNHWECHIRPDWLLIYVLDDEENTITLVRTGTHSDLFD
jgi:mRNA interferase YafQ